MNQEEFNRIQAWFKQHVNQLSCEDKEIQENIQIQIDHSYRVMNIIEELATENKLIDSDIILAQTCALLHDIGRFEQLIQLKTLSDTGLNNHWQFGTDLLKKEGVLSHLNEKEVINILQCIELHETEEFPKKIDDNQLQIAYLLQDADRIDLLALMSDYFRNNKAGTNKRLELELSDLPEISEKVLKKIVKEKVVNKKDICTLNDLKLYHMSWIFKLHFKKSYQIISEKTYLKLIFETLPKNDTVIDLYRQMKIYMENEL